MATKKINIDIVARDKSKRALKGVQGNLDKIKSKAGLLKTALIGIGGALVLKKIISVSAEFEDLRDSLTSVTGSIKNGKEAFNFIKDFATRTQFSVQQLTRSFITLKASGIDPTEKLLRTFTDTAAVTTDQIGVLEAMTRVFSRGIQGGLGLEELNQIADRGIPVWRILEEQLGLTRLSIAKFGQTTEGAKKLLDALQAGLDKEFGGATETKMDNLSTAMSNFGIAVDNSADAFGEGGFRDALTLAINQGSRFIAWIEPAITLLGKLAGLIITVVIMPFKLLGDAVAYAVAQGKKFLEWLGITSKLADEVADATNAVNEATNKLGDTLKIVAKGQFDAAEAAKKTILVNDELFESIRDRNKTEIEIINDRLQKELDLIQTQKILLQLVRDDAIAKGQMSEQMAQQLYLQKLQKFKDIELMIEKEAIKEKLDLVRSELDEIIAMREAAYNKNLQAIKSKNFHELELENLQDDQIKDLTKATGRELISELAKNNREMFMINKALAIKDAIMSTAQGVAKALAMGPWGIPLAVMIGGLGAVQVATIAKQEYTGRRLGGPVEKDRPYIVGESGREMFVPNQSGNIVPNDQLGGKSVTVNFNINTVDARGFNELLINSRGVIVNMINGAVNEKGRMAIV